MKLQIFDQDGLWTGRTLDVPESEVEANTPSGYSAIASVDAPHAKRLVDGVLVDYQPPQPSADHEWDDTEKQWHLSAAAAARAAAKTAAQQRINELERQQARAVREQLLNRGGTPAELRKRLEDIDDEITTLRSVLNS